MPVHCMHASHTGRPFPKCKKCYDLFIIMNMVPGSYYYTLLQMFTQFCLFIMSNAYVPEGGNERVRKATPTSTSIPDFHGIKALLFEFGNDIFNGLKMPVL